MLISQAVEISHDRRAFVVVNDVKYVPSVHIFYPNKTGISPPAKAGRMG